MESKSATGISEFAGGCIQERNGCIRDGLFTMGVTDGTDKNLFCDAAERVIRDKVRTRKKGM